jgi:hypothetical protein
MTLITLAVVNGTLVAALLVALAYVCSIPFRIDRANPTSPDLLLATPGRPPVGELVDDRYAA